MRIQLPGVHRVTDGVAFKFEGQSISAAPGETIAAALLNAGHLELRESHVLADKRAGLFCGMGVCGECIVLVDGIRRRACMEPARAGLKVMRHPSRAVASVFPTLTGAPTHEWPEVTLTPDVLIIGAGPAGLSAARVAASAGLEVIVVDERRAPGGQYFKQPNSGFHLEAEHLDAQFQEGRALIDAVQRSGARLLSQATVWGAFAPAQIAAKTVLGQICVSTPTERLKIQPERLVIATGAYERGVPFPGWDLPGVMTTGAAQTLLRANQISPGSRVLIAGNGPLNFQVAREMTNAGAYVVALLEAANAPGLRGIQPLIRMGLASPTLLSTGLRDRLTLRSSRVKVWHRYAVSRVVPAERVGNRATLNVTISHIDEKGFAVPATERLLAVDAVCVGYGFLPQSEIARALGCAHNYDHRTGPVVWRDSEGRTSVGGIFVAGDAGGLGGAHLAMNQGTLAGCAIVRELSTSLAASLEKEAKAARRVMARHGRFQSALWSLFSAPLLMDQLAEDDTPICRCEGVSKQTIVSLIKRGETSLGAIKRDCRAGMGTCQGRYCSTLIAELVQRSTGISTSESDLFAPRSPFRPTPINLMAAASPAPETGISEME